ncbi:hypothetical protein [Erythrobacter litoralis]|uniref:Uncharacterized protein n=1 Tax=Erythrobacter litoralis (strain HTCC2594) TaxID=314225 RepID=Q2N7D1_ERYLH|nr:hypothetical protein [Erythrobacter litoralis]ABC64410.1 hypothetical protein ELI_11590 [Erythrobacter litoralis HTCC2594]
MRYFFGYFLAAAGGGIAFSSSASEITLKLSGSLPILLGVLLAAVFIRLARGFPAIPYERVSQSQAIRATSAFRMLVKSYIAAFSTFLLALMSNIFFHAVYSDTSKVAPFVIIWFQISINLSVLISLWLIVKSDYKISMIQADLIDEVTSTKAGSDAQEVGKNVRKALKKRPTPAITDILKD